MSDSNGFDGSRPTDPISQFWFDMMSKMQNAFIPPRPGNAAEEGMKQFRQAFFDSWAKYCEEFMRSDQYLAMMKRSMDGALAFRSQMNELMTKALHQNQMPARTDTDSILLVLRGLEDRVLDRLERLNARVDHLESQAKSPPDAAAPAESKRRPKETTR